jgi:hypothetical protein
MKNIHILPTEKARLYIHQGKLYDNKKTMHIPDGTQIPHHIYITSNEEIKEGDWVYHYASHKMFKYDGNGLCVEVEKIILTTDQDLIADGVQAIDDKFLEWFVKNPSCESVEIERTLNDYWKNLQLHYEFYYKIIIPQEELEQYTSEEAAEKEFPLIDTEWCRTGACEEENLHLLGHRKSFIKGAKWQEERMYSEEDLRKAFSAGRTVYNYKGEWEETYSDQMTSSKYEDFIEWFEQFKTK